LLGFLHAADGVEVVGFFRGIFGGKRLAGLAALLLNVPVFLLHFVVEGPEMDGFFGRDFKFVGEEGDFLGFEFLDFLVGELVRLGECGGEDEEKEGGGQGCLFHDFEF
jgi:hypothetical protein